MLGQIKSGYFWSGGVTSFHYMLSEVKPG